MLRPNMERGPRASLGRRQARAAIGDSRGAGAGAEAEAPRGIGPIPSVELKGWG